MTKSQAERWEKIALDSLKDAAMTYAVAASNEADAPANVLVAGARLRLAAKSWHAAHVDKVIATAKEDA